MIVSFKNQGTKDIAENENSKEARSCLPTYLHQKARQILAIMEAAKNLGDFELPGYYLKKLSGRRAGEWSLRINSQYRICFRWIDGKAFNVEIIDYH